MKYVKVVEMMRTFLVSASSTFPAFTITVWCHTGVSVANEVSYNDEDENENENEDALKKENEEGR